MHDTLGINRLLTHVAYVGQAAVIGRQLIHQAGASGVSSPEFDMLAVPGSSAVS